MGEIADDMVDGFSCSGCGIYFAEPHRYPVLCKGCWKRASAQDRAYYQKAVNPEAGAEISAGDLSESDRDAVGGTGLRVGQYARMTRKCCDTPRGSGPHKQGCINGVR